jgi:NADH-quinone oxidoreductase subunit L
MLAYWLHLKDRPRAQKVADAFQPLTDAIEHKYWVDEIYQAAIVEPLRKLGGLFFAIDEFIIDGIVAVIGFIPQLGGFALKFSTQRGYLQGYAATMLIGIVAILVLVFVF